VKIQRFPVRLCEVVGDGRIKTREKWTRIEELVFMQRGKVKCVVVDANVDGQAEWPMVVDVMEMAMVEYYCSATSRRVLLIRQEIEGVLW
jgi:hypothetical protein